MNSSEEVQDVGNFAVGSGKCSGLVGIGGSSNAAPFTVFAFDQYIPSPSPGKLSDTFAKMFPKQWLHA